MNSPCPESGLHNSIDSIPISAADTVTAHRVLDANLNRAQEALRTLEDVARFQNNAPHQRSYKDFRHQLQSIASRWNALQLLQARDSAGDVGREQKLPSEADRSKGFSDIASAAANRLQQALRCMEEFAKFAYPTSSSLIESLRYRSYETNASFLQTLHRDASFLHRARLYVLVDCQEDADTFAQGVFNLSQEGVDLIQVRDKQADSAMLLRYAEIAIAAVDNQKTRIIVNDRADLAILSQSYGLHVGQTDWSVLQARQLIFSHQIVGLSTHDIDQVQQAVTCSADYIGCGPTFPSRTKSFERFSGLDFLKQAAPICEANLLPAFAIGGISTENVDQVLETGIQRIVVGSAIWQSDDRRSATAKIRSRIDQPR